MFITIKSSSNYVVGDINLPTFLRLRPVSLAVRLLLTYRISPIFLETCRIKRKLQGHHEFDVQLTKRQNVPATTAINTAATTVNTTNSNIL